ncbi:MAG: BF3164 family lipoprotein, partial [Bacteroidota bacterium]
LYPQVGAQNEIWSLSLTDPNARIFVCDTSGSLVKRIGNLPKRKGRFEKKDRLYAQVHQGIFSISPNKQWAATANFYNDYVQVFQHDTLAFTLRGPEKISTIWKPVKLYGNFQFVITGKTKQTYVGVDAEDDALYLLYSGKSESEAPSDFPQPGWYRALTNEIFVFGWDGSPVKRIVLDRNIIAFCVDSPNKMLYAIDFLSSDIIAYSLP